LGPAFRFFGGMCSCIEKSELVGCVGFRDGRSEDFVDGERGDFSETLAESIKARLRG